MCRIIPDDVKLLVLLFRYSYLCSTMRDINDMLSNQDALASFVKTLYNAILTDDEPWERKGRQLLLLAMDDGEKADEFFMSICGYNLDSLIKFTSDGIERFT